MSVIIQRPDSLSLLKNLKPFIFNGSSEVAFTLKKGEHTIIEETFFPGADGTVSVDVMDVVGAYLKTNLPTGNIYTQTSATASFTAYVDGVKEQEFTVVNAGVRKLSESATDFLKAFWLTWQPQTKQVTWDAPEYLSYFHVVSSKVMAKFYLKAGGDKTVQVGSSVAGSFRTYMMTFSHLFNLSGLDASELYGIIDVWVEDMEGNQLSYTQRYAYIPSTGQEHYYLAANSLGGIDTFSFTGARTLAPEIEHESAEISSRLVNNTADASRKWTQNTGYVGKQVAIWMWEFFTAAKQWHIMDGNAEEIVLDSSGISVNDRDTLNACEFSYILAEDRQLLKLPRQMGQFDEPIRIESPEGEIFFLAPRLIDYPEANLDDSLLFLVQTPFKQEWKQISLSAIRNWIASIFLPYSEMPLRMELLTNGDNFLSYGESLVLTCKVWKGMYEDVTNKVQRWEIKRDSADPAEDAAWLLKDKVRSFGGVIEISYRADDCDLATNEAYTATVFTVTAWLDSEHSATGIVEI